ncbi:MAG: hypothetical protein WD401_01995, partial [Thermomicrobiaceae bacterium]
MSDLQAVWQFVDDNREQMIADLQRLVQQKSISSSGEGVEECAELLATMMRDVGIDAHVMPTDGLPVVFGQIAADRDAAPTLLIYTHYDVQPADPEDDWESPAWEA